MAMVTGYGASSHKFSAKSVCLTMMDKIKVLELFAGTGSVSKVTELHPGVYDVVSVDISDKLFCPTFTADIMKWNYRLFQAGHFDLIWASPPCESSRAMVQLHACTGKQHVHYCTGTQYSIARTTGGPRDIEGANKIVKKVLEMIDYFQPAVALIENPSTGLLKEQPFMQSIPSHVVSYCRYAPEFGYRKQTMIWVKGTHGIPRFVGKTCSKHQRCEGFQGKHTKTFSGKTNSKVSLADRYRIPPALIEDLLIHASESIQCKRDEEAEINLY